MGKKEFKVKGTAEVQRPTRFHRHGEAKMGGFIIIGLPPEESPEDVELVDQLKRHSANRPVILLSGNNSETQIEAALKIGVSDMFKWQCSTHDILEQFKSSHSDTEQHEFLSPVDPEAENGGFITGESEMMKKIKNSLMKIAVTDCNVLLTGETGTGKDVAAEFIHKNSGRSSRPLMCVNCTAIPETLLESELFGYEKGAFTSAMASRPGKFEMAAGGTLFLDEIGDMGLNAQGKILRAIEKKEIWRIGGDKPCFSDFRLITATNREPEHLISIGKFRDDLYYRLNIARVHLPPLRDRKEDIAALVNHIIGCLNIRFKMKVRGIAPDVMDLFLSHSWPGNVRQLSNVIEASYINSPHPVITLRDLPQSFWDAASGRSRKPNGEWDKIEKTLLETGWNISKTASKLNVSRMTLYRKIARYGISRKGPL